MHPPPRASPCKTLNLSTPRTKSNTHVTLTAKRSKTPRSGRRPRQGHAVAVASNPRLIAFPHERDLRVEAARTRPSRHQGRRPGHRQDGRNPPPGLPEEQPPRPRSDHRYRPASATAPSPSPPSSASPSPPITSPPPPGPTSSCSASNPSRSPPSSPRSSPASPPTSSSSPSPPPSPSAPSRQAAGCELAVMRAMPNTPAMIGAGVTALCSGRFCSPDQIALGAKDLRHRRPHRRRRRKTHGRRHRT